MLNLCLNYARVNVPSLAIVLAIGIVSIISLALLALYILLPGLSASDQQKATYDKSVLSTYGHCLLIALFPDSNQKTKLFYC